MGLTNSDWIVLAFSFANLILAISIFIYTWRTNKVKPPKIVILEYIMRTQRTDEIKIDFHYMNDGGTTTRLFFTGFLELNGQLYRSSEVNKVASCPIKEASNSHVHFKDTLQKGIDYNNFNLFIYGHYFDHKTKIKIFKSVPIPIRDI